MEFHGSPLFIGYLPSNPAGGTATTSLNASTSRVAYALIGRGKTLSRYHVHIGAINGTLITTDVECALQASSGNNPSGTDLQVRNPDNIPGTLPNLMQFSGFTTALTAGERYWLVFRNVNASPATNNLSLRTVNASPIGREGVAGLGVTKKTSGDGGSSWGSPLDVSSWRVDYSDNSSEGYMLTDSTISSSSFGIYSNRELGTQFKTPRGTLLRVVGTVFVLAGPTGTPTGALRARLYSGTGSLISTSQALTPAGQTGNGFIAFDFPNVIELIPGGLYTITIGETTNSDASGNRHDSRMYSYSASNPAPREDLLGWGFGFSRAYFDGFVWTVDAFNFTPFALILDKLQPTIGRPLRTRPVSLR